MDNKEKLNKAVKLAQSYILLLLKEYLSSEPLLSIEKLFEKCPIVVEKIDTETNAFGKTTKVDGLAQNDKVIINLVDIEKINMNNEIELNELIGIIIHEYAHKIIALNNRYGEMLEETFATLFAEVCINNARLKLNNDKNIELFEMRNSVGYQKYESQLRALLYILKQKDLDIKMIVEYVAGNQEKFIQVCSQLFGNEFNNYFSSITSRNNQDSEQILITQYIKRNGLNIRDYWKKDSNQLTSDHLYFHGSATLSRAVVNTRSEIFKPEEQEFYKMFEYSVKVANENESFIDQEKIDRIKQFIRTKFSLSGKSIEEIYDTIIDLCSTYIQCKNKEDEESKIFIEEITKEIPNIDNFKNNFVNLRISGQDKKIFDNLDLDNITYSDIAFNMNRLLNLKDEESRVIK